MNTANIYTTTGKVRLDLGLMSNNAFLHPEQTNSTSQYGLYNTTKQQNPAEGELSFATIYYQNDTPMLDIRYTFIPAINYTIEQPVEYIKTFNLTDLLHPPTTIDNFIDLEVGVQVRPNNIQVAVNNKVIAELTNRTIV
eukprot:UN03193